MKPTYIFLILLILLNVGCTNTSIPYEEDELHHFSGEVFGIVPQDGYVLPNKSKSRYALSLHNFYPEGEEFDEFNRKHQNTIERIIDITDNTKIYDENDSEIVPTDVEIGSAVEFKVIVADEFLEAIEIKVIKSASE
ncbi:hypothetical protein [Caldalkalibacillus mannanilyticus]|uniref:hypothetical protein n=1 Tax=Caldalkalibacillus mannanilyticus TaxID=1418 RepID=UPI0004689A4A|nr:hypothetical protein [Caldalkalibacillus mannanilyticus]